MGKYQRYHVVFRFLQIVMKPLMWWKHRFQTERIPSLEEPCLVLSNHTTEEDMWFVGIASPKTLHYVVGEHLLRNPFYGKLLRYFVNPIPVPKGGNGMSSILEMRKRIRAGENVCIFPEGKRSYHGETIPVSESFAHMVKKLGCALVTYRLQGGYFVYPRWARGNKRKGHIEGKVSGVYSSAQVSAMTDEELQTVINRDLYENAFATQREKMWRYQGKNLTKGLDTVLFFCPACQKEETLSMEKNTFRCTACGLTGTYDDYGFFRGDRLPYDNVLDWMRWEEGKFDEKVLSAPKDSIISQCDFARFYRMDDRYCNHTLREGAVTVTAEAITVGDFTFPFADIPYLSVLYGDTLFFTYEDTYYGITGEKFRAWKCARLWHLQKGDTNDRTKEI